MQVERVRRLAAADRVGEGLDHELVERGLAAKDELVVQTFAYPIGGGESTNTLHLHRVR